jgi:hypothetical protein
MKSGLVIIAINNELVDYVSMARWSAKRIQHFLKMPTSLITDVDIDNDIFDHVIKIDPNNNNQKYYQDFDSVTEWYNQSRSDVYALSPYQQTLVIDADYVVNSQDINKIFDYSGDFLCPQKAFDINTKEGQYFSTEFGQINMPMSWATMMFFRKSKYADAIFSVMAMIRDHWDHYRALYQISNNLYRNDYALSMALSIVNGHNIIDNSIPWAMATVMPEYKLTQLEYNRFRVEYMKNQKQYYIELVDQDFHALCKKQLGAIVEHHR